MLCHGWPELAYSWRKVVPILVEAGLHVIVPEQRGFGMTGKALNDAGDESGVPLYDMTHLTGDLAHLLDAMDIEKAIFTGHDWGGFVIWQMPFFHPTRTAGLIGVNTPYVPRLSDDRLSCFAPPLVRIFTLPLFKIMAAPKWFSTPIGASSA